MIGKKYWIVYLIFSIIIVLAMVGGNWDTTLAQGTVPTTPPPPPAPAAPAAVAPAPGVRPIITAGIGHTCAITPTDGLRCWGLNDSGQLGDETFNNSSIPVNVVDVVASDVIDLESGIKHTCALSSGGEVMCWGLNTSGQLGNGSITNSNVPVLVKGLVGKVVSISGGAEFTCAVNDVDEVMCWGNNSVGQLNDSTTTNRNVATIVDPEIVNNVVMISGGQKELQGVTSDGVANIWNSEPVIPVTGLPNENNVLLSADRFFEGGCITSIDRVVRCWGAIVDAEVTDGVLDSDLLDTGGGHACTVNDSGLVCWGENNHGQLGVGSEVSSEKALPVEGITSVVDLAAGLNHTCAIIGTDTIKCWGENTYGQLGDGSTSDKTLPVVVK